MLDKISKEPYLVCPLPAVDSLDAYRIVLFSKIPKTMKLKKRNAFIHAIVSISIPHLVNKLNPYTVVLATPKTVIYKSFPKKYRQTQGLVMLQKT